METDKLTFRRCIRYRDFANLARMGHSLAVPLQRYSD
jgi:hypothetical protein